MWEAKPEDAAAPFRAHDTDRATVLFNDRLANWQPQPGAPPSLVARAVGLLILRKDAVKGSGAYGNHRGGLPGRLAARYQRAFERAAGNHRSRS